MRSYTFKCAGSCLSRRKSSLLHLMVFWGSSCRSIRLHLLFFKVLSELKDFEKFFLSHTSKSDIQVISWLGMHWWWWGRVRHPCASPILGPMQICSNFHVYWLFYGLPYLYQPWWEGIIVRDNEPNSCLSNPLHQLWGLPSELTTCAYSVRLWRRKYNPNRLWIFYPYSSEEASIRDKRLLISSLASAIPFLSRDFSHCHRDLIILVSCSALIFVWLELRMTQFLRLSPFNRLFAPPQSILWVDEAIPWGFHVSVSWCACCVCVWRWPPPSFLPFYRQFFLFTWTQNGGFQTWRNHCRKLPVGSLTATCISSRLTERLDWRLARGTWPLQSFIWFSLSDIPLLRPLRPSDP